MIELILILSSLDLELVIGLKAFLQERNYRGLELMIFLVFTNNEIEND